MYDNAFACAIFLIFFLLAFSCSLTRSVSVKVFTWLGFYICTFIHIYVGINSCQYVYIVVLAAYHMQK